MSDKLDPNQPTIYQIRIKGHLGQQWADWFEGLSITLEENGDTLLTGPVIDDAALARSAEKSTRLGNALDRGQSGSSHSQVFTFFYKTGNP